jgi:hypothetical protein
MAEVVMDDMAIGNPASLLAQLWRFGPLPRHPYSAVPFPSNWELWRNFPDAMQQSLQKISASPDGTPTRIEVPAR